MKNICRNKREKDDMPVSSVASSSSGNDSGDLKTCILLLPQSTVQ